MPRTASNFVTLKNGPTLPLEPWLLALRLEAKGLRLSVEGDELVVQPGGHLSTEERPEIRRWKLHLMAIAAYETATI